MATDARIHKWGRNFWKSREVFKHADGLWILEFISSLNHWESGVVVFQDGRILGGGASYWYNGNYKTENGLIRGVMQVTRFDPNAISIFGDFTAFSLNISLKITGNSLNGFASLVRNPDVRMAVQGIKKVDIERYKI